MGVEVGLRQKLNTLVPCLVFEGRPSPGTKTVVAFQRSGRVQQVLYNGPEPPEDEFAIECRAGKIEEARTLIASIRDGINGFAGLLPDGSEVWQIEVVDQDDDVIDLTGDGEDERKVVVLRVVVHHPG